MTNMVKIMFSSNTTAEAMADRAITFDALALARTVAWLGGTVLMFLFYLLVISGLPISLILGNYLSYYRGQCPDVILQQNELATSLLMLSKSLNLFIVFSTTISQAKVCCPAKLAITHFIPQLLRDHNL